MKTEIIRFNAFGGVTTKKVNIKKNKKEDGFSLVVYPKVKATK